MVNEISAAVLQDSIARSNWRGSKDALGDPEAVAVRIELIKSITRSAAYLISFEREKPTDSPDPNPHTHLLDPTYLLDVVNMCPEASARVAVERMIAKLRSYDSDTDFQDYKYWLNYEQVDWQRAIPTTLDVNNPTEWAAK